MKKDRIGQTRVFYRRIVKNPQAGEVIAVFPDDILDDHGKMSTYMHEGQYSGCSAKFLLKDTVASNTGCDAHGCINVELSSQGYNNLKTVTIHEMNGDTKAKCLYCNSGAEPTHFICEDCGDGMCEECYNTEAEHDSHYQDPAEAAETEEEYLLMEDVFGNGYACERCVQKVTQMIKNIREKELKIV